MKRTLRIFIIVILLLLGGVSVFMTSSVLFDWFGIREMEGNYVPFVVYANLICGLIYLYAVYFLIKNQKRAVWLLTFATGLLLVTSIAFAIYIYLGGIHEEKTVLALVFRTSITAFLAWLSFYIFKNHPITQDS